LTRTGGSEWWEWQRSQKCADEDDEMKARQVLWDVVRNNWGEYNECMDWSYLNNDKSCIDLISAHCLICC
jgi:hypothetical protein